jgi:hypothetical protein
MVMLSLREETNSTKMGKEKCIEFCFEGRWDTLVGTWEQRGGPEGELGKVRFENHHSGCYMKLPCHKIVRETGLGYNPRNPNIEGFGRGKVCKGKGREDRARRETR